MTDFNNIYSSAFEDIFPPVFGATVNYSRGVDSVDVVAMSSEISTEQKTEFGASLTTNSREFIISVDDLVLNNVAVMPARNDQIAETINGVETLFEVTNIGNSPEWEYEDSDREYFRIRAVQVN